MPSPTAWTNCTDDLTDFNFAGVNPENNIAPFLTVTGFAVLFLVALNV